MRLVYYAFIIISIISCSSANNNPKAEVKKSSVEILIDSFVSKHPNGNSNEVVKKRLDDSLKAEYLVAVDHGLLDSFPVELKSVKELLPGRYTAHFQYWNSVSEIPDIALDIAGEIKKEDVGRLEEKKLYIVNCSSLKTIYDEDFDRYGIFRPYSVSFNAFSNPKTLGVVLVKINSVNEFKYPYR
jgi:hypothetical protein